MENRLPSLGCCEFGRNIGSVGNRALLVPELFYNQHCKEIRSVPNGTCYEIPHFSLCHLHIFRKPDEQPNA